MTSHREPMMRPVPLVTLLLCGLAITLSSCGGKDREDRQPIDETAPVVTITTPTTLATYRSPATPLLLGGVAWDDVGVVTVSWSNADTGDSGVASGTSTWTASIPLGSGWNGITITASDAAGRDSTDSIAVTLDTVAPTVSIREPTTAPTFTTRSTPILLAGIANDDKGVKTVTWSNGATGGSGEASWAPSWNASVPLIPGDNVVTVSASDSAGNVGTDSITVTLDPGQPMVTIQTPTAESIYTTSATPILLGGVAVDDMAVTSVTWSNVDTGDSGTAIGMSSWSASVPLSPGSNTISVTAHDADAKVGTDSIRLVLSVPPSLDTLKGWGRNDYGQVGDGTDGNDRATPTQVIDPTDPSGFLTGIAGVSAGALHTAVVLADGTVRAWGHNDSGQLGDGAINWTQPTPVQVLDPSDPSGLLTGVIAVSAGRFHTATLLRDGTVRSWGRNNYGQAGDGTFLDRAIPVQVVDPSDPTGFLANVTAIDAGDDYTVALVADGTVRAWGYNYRGQLGDGTSLSFRLTPVQVVDLSDPTGFLTDVIAVSAGKNHTVALLPDGTARAWGENYHGELGDGTTTDSAVSVQVVDPTDPSGFLTGVTAVAAGTFHTEAVLADGTVREWGWGWGAGASSIPLQVPDPSDPSGYLTGVSTIEAGSGLTVALLDDGSIRTWGGNSRGQLGDGTFNSSLVPVRVIDPSDPSGYLTGVEAISARGKDSMALK